MTPESLQRINDLRMRIAQADAATRDGQPDLARSLMPSDLEIVEALRAARNERTAAVKASASKAEARAEVSKIRTMDINELFS